MARFLFTYWPFPGEIYQPLSIALALQARGHSIAFYTGARVQLVLEEQGCTVFPFQDLDEAKVWDAFVGLESSAADWRSARSLVTFLRRWLVDSLPDQVSDLQRIVATWQPDVIVASPYMYGPPLVLRELLTVPIALSTVTIFCLIPGKDVPPYGPGLPPPRNWRTRLLARGAAIMTDVTGRGLRRQVDQTRARYGLAPLGGTVNSYTARLPLYLVPSIRELDYGRRDLPPSVHYVGPCIWNKPSTAQAPEWLDELPTNQPWVHVTEGTLHYQEPLVLRAAAQGLANRPMQVILTTGLHRDPESLHLGAVAPNIVVKQWVSHSDLLPRCAVVVTTGGAGTVMAALQLGIPLIIVPTALDKPENAQRVVEAGVGLRLAPRHCTPERLRAAVEHILNEPKFRDNAQQLAQRLSAERGPETAADLLENLVPASPSTAH